MDYELQGKMTIFVHVRLSAFLWDCDHNSFVIFLIFLVLQN